MFKEIYAVLTAIMFASLGILAKSVYESQVTANTMFFKVCFFSMILFYIINNVVNKKDKSLKISKRDFALSFFGGGFLCLFLTNFSVLIALQYIDTGVQRIITYSAPLFSIIFYFLVYKRKPLNVDIISIALIVIGLYFVVGDIDISLSSYSLKGLFFSFLASVSIGIYSVITAEEKTSLDTSKYWFYAFLGGLTFSFIQIAVNNSFSNFIYLLDGKIMTLILLISLHALYYFFKIY